MAQNAPQPDDAPPSAATLPDSARAAGDEEELLDVLADQMVDQILSEQADELTGPAPGLDEGELIETSASATDRQEPAATSDRAHDDGADAPDEQYVTGKELGPILGPLAAPIGPDDAQTDAAFAGESAPQGEPGPVAEGSVTPDDMNALFERAAAGPEAEAPAQAPHQAEPEPSENEPVRQNDMDASLAQDAAETEPMHEPAKHAATPAASKSVNHSDMDALFEHAVRWDTGDDESQSGLDALFGAAEDQTQVDADELDPGDAESPAATEGDKLNSEQLDDLLSQAVNDTGAGAAMDADDLEAVLEQQQADHPDPAAGPSAAPSPAEAVGSGEAQALRVEQPPPSPAAAPVASLEEVDALLAERAEQGAAAADIASDATLPATGDDDGSTEAIAIPGAAADPTPSVAHPLAPTSDADPIAGTAKPKMPFMVPDTRDEPAEAAEPAEPAAEFSPGVRGAFIRLLDRINEPFVNLSPDTRDVLGYVAVALMGLSLMLTFKSLLS